MLDQDRDVACANGSCSPAEIAGTGGPASVIARIVAEPDGPAYGMAVQRSYPRSRDDPGIEPGRPLGLTADTLHSFRSSTGAKPP